MMLDPDTFAFGFIFVCMIVVVILISVFVKRGPFDSVSIFDNQPQSLGVYNLQDIEPVILKSA
jgi:hypothetical protein